MATTRNIIARLAYGVAITLTLAWVGGAVAAPLLAAHSPDLLAAMVYHAYGQVCHQIAERSFHLLGHPVAVCGRCLGIYTGYLVGLFIYPFARRLTREDFPPRLWLLLALAPVTVDFLGGYAGLFENTLSSRAFTGAIAGAAGAFYTLPGFISLATSLSGAAAPSSGGLPSAKESS
ncbi:MAG TPA: DUF2085 domain-containing protein [Blastocatellia bacterium]|nr:DUF2085 domain-containing protein [Blastocatellia bacterium]